MLAFANRPELMKQYSTSSKYAAVHGDISIQYNTIQYNTIQYNTIQYVNGEFVYSVRVKKWNPKLQNYDTQRKEALG